MNCPNCQTVNDSENRFCCNCGKPLRSVVTAGEGGKVTQPAATAGNNNLLTPSTLLQDRYRITQLVGQGGMGAIYLANDTRFSSKLCIVKEMLDHFHEIEQRELAKQNFYREADLLANLKHNSIPEVFDRFTEANRHYLVMEYINGTDLEQRMHENGGPFDEKLVLGWAIQTCDVLSYLHHQKPPIIYRDMKPANLILTSFGKIYLVDFGIARFFNPQARGTMIGTQGYAPPEQYRGQVEQRTDIYALGATMHYLLTGRDPQNEPPFSFPAIRALNPNVSTETELVIMRTLEPDIEKRYPTADDLLVDLIRIGGEETGAVRHCPHCSKRISRGRQFCPHCRKYIAAHHTSTHDKIHKAATARNLSLPTTKSSPTLFQRSGVLVATGVLLFVLAFVLAYLLLPK
ncbi:MAG: protein kinase [Cyanobacteria bacterium NC_groundwater_1444_Ag_S-0.65um_54_12]|nr:protein kinase [Cyanobacteria bacterium NC_groundwater_1444_Ag_S-0.65um_54_12]